MNLSEWFLIFLILISTFGIVVDIFSWKRPNLRLSNKDINKLAKKSLEQYLYSDLIYRYHLCVRSREFRKVWKKHSNQIKELGREFLEETKLKANIGDESLFYCERYEDSFEVRIMFLGWLIKKTE